MGTMCSVICPTAVQMGASGAACTLPALMASGCLGCQRHGPRSAIHGGLCYQRGSALEGPWLSRRQFGLKSSPHKSRLSILRSQCFQANFQYVLTWRIDRGVRHPIAARTKRHLCINQLPYGSNGARPGSSANASREISATERLQQKAMQHCSNYKVLRTRGPHRTHAGSKVANAYWEMNTDDASNSWEISEGLQGRQNNPSSLCVTTLFFRISISVTFTRTLGALRQPEIRLQCFLKNVQLKHNQKSLSETE